VCGPLSLRQKCHDCGVGKLALNDLQLHDHRGPFFDHWRRRSLAALGVMLPDDDPPSPWL
jgi:hypothetical protein